MKKLLFLCLLLTACGPVPQHSNASNEALFPITKNIEPKYKFTEGSGLGITGYMYIINNDTIILNSEGGVYKY